MFVQVEAQVVSAGIDLFSAVTIVEGSRAGAPNISVRQRSRAHLLRDSLAVISRFGSAKALEYTRKLYMQMRDVGVRAHRVFASCNQRRHSTSP